MEKILVTGHLGYLGIKITEKLIEQGYKVSGIDTNYYRDRFLFQYKLDPDVKSINKDIREINNHDLEGFDAIIHLAALSNDPLGALNPALTNLINHDASLKLAIKAKNRHIERFLFSSSCSIYGAFENEYMIEESHLNPQTPYAKSKIDLENSLMKIADSNFSPVFLRNSTAFGISPNMRFDLVVNNLMGWAFTTQKIKILSDGKSWRPIIHVKDIANAFIAALKAPKDLIHNEAFNIGINSENFQVITIAEKIEHYLPDCEIEILGKGSPDSRNYKVNFDKFNNRFKEFKPEFSLEKGIKELFEVFRNINLNYEIFSDKNFTRINQLTHLLQNGLLDSDLYWI